MTTEMGDGDARDARGDGRNDIRDSGAGGGAGDGDLSIRAAQQLVDEWIRTVGVRYFSPLTNCAILTEEVGEVARILARRYGDQSEKPSDAALDLGDELADVLWVVFALANQTEVDLTEALRRNVEKKTHRDSERHRTNEKLRNP
jgi:NTP pyrophosphatase (non-canonical NTP hydrolase)